MEFKNFGKYTMLKKLASGGMADIFLSINLSPTGFGRFVVIKRALSRFSNNPEFREMFKNEARVVCNLKHKNIVPIYEFGIEKNQLFLVMEYITGSTVRELTKRLKVKSKALSLPNAVYIVKEVAAGLNYAHNAIDNNSGLPLNIIHRDVSPQNIMLSFDGEIKLIDFGIAKVSDVNLTKVGHLKGKFSYMSPEQAEGKPLDARTDVFCLGIILWELLTGKRLFASSNELASLKKVRNCDIPDAQKINSSIPTELNNIIKKSLEKNKNLRYKSAANFEQSLSFFLNKNYPEFSQYDFITLMKTLYRKKIMTERETLKVYSTEFKRYINSLNLEKTFKNSLVLDIPDIGKSNNKQSVVQNTATQTLQTEDKKSLSLQQTMEQNRDLSVAKSQSAVQLSGDKSTIVKSEFRDGQNTDFSESQIETGKTSHPVKKQLTRAGSPVFKSASPSSSPEDKPKLKLVEGGHSTMSSQFTKSHRSLYSQEAFLGEEEDQPFINKVQSWGLVVFGLLLVAVGLYYFTDFKNGLKSPLDLLSSFTSQSELEKSSDLPDLADSPQPIQKKSSVTHRQPTESLQTARISSKFIQSKPSNAEIYVNGQFISKYTPVLLDLDWKSVRSITLKKAGYSTKKVFIDPDQSQDTINVVLNRSPNRQGGARSNVEIINID